MRLYMPFMQVPYHMFSIDDLEILLLSYFVLVIDKDAAWNEMHSVHFFGDGNSLSNSLFWIASRGSTRKAVDSPSLYPTTITEANATFEYIIYPECALNSACDAQGKYEH